MYVKNDVPYSCYFATIVNYSNQLLPVNFQWYVYCYITQNKAFPRLFCVELVCVSNLYCLQLNTNADFLNRITLSHWNLKIVNMVKGNSRKIRNIPTYWFFKYKSVIYLHLHNNLLKWLYVHKWKVLCLFFKFSDAVSFPLNMKILHLKISRWIWQILTSVPTPTITTFQTLANLVADPTLSFTPQCRITLDHATILEISRLLFLHQQVN